MTCSDLPARVWQHEIDHLHGVLFIDKMGSIGRHRSQKDLDKFIADFEKRKRKGKTCHRICRRNYKPRMKSLSYPRLSALISKVNFFLNIHQGSSSMRIVMLNWDICRAYLRGDDCIWCGWVGLIISLKGDVEMPRQQLTDWQGDGSYCKQHDVMVAQPESINTL